MEMIEIQRVFAERLKELMAEKGVRSIAELSERVGIPRPTISRWIGMTRSPQIDSLVRISKFFGATTDYLLGLEN